MRTFVGICVAVMLLGASEARAQALETHHGHPVPISVSPIGSSADARTNFINAAMSWDGHLLVACPEVAQNASGQWQVVTESPTRAIAALALRPETVTLDAVTGAPSFSSALSDPVLLDDRTGSAPVPQNPLTIVSMARATTPSGQNPYPSDLLGQPAPAGIAGSCDTYDAYCVMTNIGNTPAEDNIQRFRVLVVIQNPRTPQASIARAVITEAPTPLTYPGTSGPVPLLGKEPSITLDGRLIVFNGTGSVHYSYNADPTSTSGWSTPAALSHFFFESQTTVLAGLTLAQRYPLSQQQLRHADGFPFTDGERVPGVYTWVSFDGSEAFWCGASAEAGGQMLGAGTLAGRATGWTLRLLDGPINSSRYQRAILVTSPGMSGSFWQPFRGSGAPLPYTGAPPIYAFLQTTFGYWCEVPLEDSLDGDYVLALRMNELVDDQAVYRTDRTPDTSGQFNTGILEGARFPGDYLSQWNTAGVNVDVHDGIVGSCVYLGPNDRVRVPQSSSLVLGSTASVELWVKPLAAGRLALVESPGAFRLWLDDDGSVYLDVGGRALGPLNPGAPITPGSDPVLAAVKARQAPDPADLVSMKGWVHIAFTYDGVNGTLRGYKDGRPTSTISVTPGPLGAPTGDLLLGPAGSGPQGGEAVCMLDEVFVSRVVRSDIEVSRHAYYDPPAPVFATPGPLPLGLAASDARIPLTSATSSDAIQLGRQLFFDTALSRDRSLSCSSCHKPSEDMTDGLPIAKGYHGQLGTRRSPRVVNRELSTLQFWDGRAASLEDQSVMPVENPIELDFSVSELVARLQATPAYVASFQATFGAQPISRTTIGLALAAFERSILSGDSAVDRFERDLPKVKPGDPLPGQLNLNEQNGRLLFHGKARCITCHSGSNYTDELFHANGNTASTDPGRGKISGRTADAYAFKAPSLRSLLPNSGSTTFFLHDGSVTSLSTLVHDYDRGGVAGAVARDREIRPLELTSDEESDLVLFLQALQAGTDVTAPVPFPPGGPESSTLTNPRFDASLTGWDAPTGGASWLAQEPSRTPARTGIAVLVPGATEPAALEQTIRVASPELTAVVAQLLPGSASELAATAVTLAIRDASGTTTVLKTLPSLSFAQGWYTLSGDLTPWVGQTVTIRIEANLASGAAWDVRGIGVDSVALGQ